MLTGGQGGGIPGGLPEVGIVEIGRSRALHRVPGPRHVDAVLHLVDDAGVKDEGADGVGRGIRDGIGEGVHVFAQVLVHGGGDEDDGPGPCGLRNTGDAVAVDGRHRELVGRILAQGRDVEVEDPLRHACGVEALDGGVRVAVAVQGRPVGVQVSDELIPAIVEVGVLAAPGGGQGVVAENQGELRGRVRGEI